MVPALIISILFFSAILIKAADLLIVALRRIARNTHTGVFALSAIILAVGTSFPELFVGITSALEGSSSLTLGVVMGSNIANIALIAGITGLVVGKINVHGSFLKKDVWIALAAGVLPLLLVLDKSLSRVDGLILLSVYAAYATSFFRGRYLEIAEEHKKENFVYRFFREVNHIDSKKTKEMGRLFLGIALLLFSADMIVRLSESLASTIGIPVFVVGVVILAIGTSLPELAFSLRSIEDHQPSMFFGNILGSTIANSTLILGVTTIINPIEIMAINQYVIAAVAFIVVFLAFWAYIKSGHKLERKEAVVLLLLYAIFIVVELL